MSEDLQFSGPRSVARFYTLARRIPTLIGRTSDGTRIPGGPYTVTQVGAAFVTVLVLWKTTGVWAHLGFMGNLAIAGGALSGVVFLAGRIPTTGRNPATLVVGIVAVLANPKGGTREGNALSVPAPHRLSHHTRWAPPVAAARPPARSTRPAAPVEPPVGASRVALSGVQLLLAGADRKDNHA